jgi:hypothetical protein
MHPEVASQCQELLLGAGRVPQDHPGHWPRAELLGILDDQLAGQILARETIVEPVTNPDFLDRNQGAGRKLLDLGDHRPWVEGDGLDDLLRRVTNYHCTVGAHGWSRR